MIFVKYTEPIALTGPNGQRLTVRVAKNQFIVSLQIVPERTARASSRGRPAHPATLRLRQILQNELGTDNERMFSDYASLYAAWNPSAKAGGQIVRREIKRIREQLGERNKVVALDLTDFSERDLKIIRGDGTVRLR